MSDDRPDLDALLAELRERVEQRRREGLYPEGDFRAVPSDDGTVSVTLDDVNLDARLLIQALEKEAAPRSLTGRLTIGSFKEAMPEHMLRLVFEDGAAWVQRPLLWSHAS